MNCTSEKYNCIHTEIYITNNSRKNWLFCKEYPAVFGKVKYIFIY